MKMIQNLFIFFLALSCNSLDCNKFKTGKFEVQSKNVGKIIIERTENFQTETLLKTGDKVRYKIKWKNDCSFIMFDREWLSGNDMSDAKEKAELNRDTIFSEIIEIDGNEYKTKSKFSNYPDWFESTTTKIQ